MNKKQRQEPKPPGPGAWPNQHAGQNRKSALCNGKFCQLLATYQPPSKGLDESFDSWLTYQLPIHEHRFQRDPIPVGTWAEIRTRIHCPFCRFVQTVVGARSYADSSLCTAKVSSRLNGFDLSFPGTDSFMMLGERIIPVGRSAQAGARCGRLADPNGLDYSMIKNWLACCDRLHRDTCPIPTSSIDGRARGPPRLRVVDVLKNCLVDIPWEWKYAALSYVWGVARPPKLMKAELPSLMRHGALRGIRSNAPKTIQDAMEFVSRVGVQYLWFDSLCLVQDDPSDLDRGIQNMDIVYESAYFTVVAACGDGADSGLAGVGQTPRGAMQDLVSVKPGLDLLRVKALDHYLRSSVWASRGWTLQEYYLSRRTINFVNGQVYFKCRKRMWCEETWADLDPSLQNGQEWSHNLINDAQQAMDEGGIKNAYWFLFEAVVSFQRRELTWEGDAIKAMTGITNRVAKAVGTEFLEGLPVKVFPEALMFANAPPLKWKQLAPQRQRAFPSWSWAGWANEDSYWANENITNLEVFETPSPGRHTTWYKFRPKENPELVWKPKAGGLEDSSDFPSWLHDVRTDRPYPLLCFSMLAAVFTVSRCGRDRLLFDKQGQLAGHLSLDFYHHTLNDQPIEIILPGAYLDGGSRVSWIGQSPETTGRFMYINWDGDVYERRGVGKLYLGSLQNLEGPVWRTIVLG